MTGKAGVWIDHRKAVIVALTPDGERTTTILAKVEKHLERGGDSPLKGSFEAAPVPADDRRQRALTGELNVFYDSVIAVLRESHAVLRTGPGEAKDELHSRLKTMKLGGRVVAAMTEDKMTDPQIAAKVRDHFRVDPPGG